MMAPRETNTRSCCKMETDQQQEEDENQSESKALPQQEQAEAQEEDIESTTRCMDPSETLSTTTMMHPLSSFLHALLEENASLAEAEIVLDRAAILPDKKSQSCQLLEAHSSSFANSMPELSRWDSHIVRTSPAALEREREKEQKAAYQLFASPTRPQRRTSFEAPRSGETISTDRRALSQSLSQLSMLQEEEMQKVCKSALPPRVPVRRSSSRVMSPPPPDVQTRGRQQQQQQQPQQPPNNEESEEFASSNSFHLEFSESDRHEDDSFVFEAAKDTLSLSVEDDTPRRPASYEYRALRGTRVRSMSPRHTPPEASHRRIASNAAGVRRTSLSMELARKPNALDALPQLEGFSNPPHQRVLPSGGGSNLSLAIPAENNTAPQPHGDDTELNLTKVASSRVMPMSRGRRTMDAMEEKVNPSDPNSPTTVKKAAKKNFLGRMKNKVQETLKSKPRGRSKSPVRLPVRQESVSSHGY